MKKQTQICSQIIHTKDIEQQYYATSKSQLFSKRVSFAEGKVNAILNLKNRFKSKNKTNSILKSNYTHRRSNSIFSQNASILNGQDSKKTNIDQIKGQNALTTYRNLLKQFEQKIERSLKGTLRDKKKQIEGFNDEIFPPVYSSLFSINKASLNCRKRLGGQIIWKRIPQVYGYQNLKLRKINGKSSSTVITQGSYGSDYFAKGFQNIQNNEQFLQTVLHQNILNRFGIYCLRIFHESGWRYVLIDDYIPVLQIDNNNKKYLPAFLQINSSTLGQKIQIWPLLLQKAYASYFCTYEALQYGNYFDFLEEITGCGLFPQKQNCKNNHKDNHQNVIITQISKEGVASNCENNQLKYFLHFKSNNFKVSKIIPPKQLPSHKWFFPYLRKITVLQNTILQFLIRQKDERFYHQSSVIYAYTWIRAILLGRELEDYRWIDGQYSNTKSINFKVPVTTGQYYLLIMPQWKSVHRHEITIIVRGESQCFQIQNSGYDWKEQMLQKGCSDLAQRQGIFQQINNFTCSYSIKHKRSGMVIENIHNQRIGGNIVIKRQWRNDGCWIKPFNPQFKIIEGKIEAEVQIQKEGQYTVVLLCVGGRKQNQFDSILVN